MPKTILVADDSRTMQEAIRLVLQPQGYELVTCETGSKALQVAREVRPNLVVADLRMPEGDGAWLSEQLRSDAALAHTPVLLLYPGSEQPPEAVQRRSGASALLPKPFLSAELSELCRQLLRSTAERRPAAEAPAAAATAAAAAAAAAARSPTPASALRAASSSLAERISRMEEVLGRRGGSATAEGGGRPATPEGPPDESAVLDALRQAGRAFQRGRPAEPPAAGSRAAAGASGDPTAAFRSFSPPAISPPLGLAGPAAAASRRADSAALRRGLATREPPPASSPVSSLRTASASRRPDEPRRPLTREDLLDAVRQVAREAIERAVWDMVPDIAERILWEVVPEITESVIRENLREARKG